MCRPRPQLPHLYLLCTACQAVISSNACAPHQKWDNPVDTITWCYCLDSYVTKDNNLTGKFLSIVQPCWRKCGAVNVDHSHIFWLCPEIVKFWGNVHLVIVKILGWHIQVLYVSLGNMTTHIVFGEDGYLLKVLLVASKKAIMKKWHTIGPPSHLKIVTYDYIYSTIWKC